MTDEFHKLGEVLRAAREAKGVDLVRVERETKIRERYLAALESGDYRDLPGAVYTRGFLRNYGTYLGLDTDYLLDLYRLETHSTPSAPRAALPEPPRPIGSRPARAFVVTPGAIVAAVLVLLVGGFVAWIGFELVNFARTPELRITQPAGNVIGHTERTMVVRGVTVPNARITISNLPENPTITADASGEFEVTVQLLPGSNVMRLTATDPVTGRDSETVERTILVDVDASPAASPTGEITLTAPVAGASLTGPISVSGVAPAGTALEIRAQLVAASRPTFEVTTASGAPVTIEPADPAPPGPVTLTAAQDGAFEGSIDLAPGTWELVVRAGTGDPIVRQVVVLPSPGLTATLEIDGGESYLLLEEDGDLVEEVSGLNAQDGDVIELAADEALRIRVGNAGVVRITINGVSIGLMGDIAQVVEWRVTRSEGG